MAVAVGATVLMSLTWPHNYDEAYNYIYFADRGFRYIVTNYHAPNNHVFFTLFQGLIPRGMVEWEPIVLRIPNLFASAALIGVLAWDRERLWASPLKAVAIVFAGMFAVQFLGQARGYHLATLLTTLALLSAVRLVERPWGPIMAAGLMALATWTIPTFAYGAPIIGIYYALERRVRAAFAYSAVFVLLVLLLYRPIMGQILSDYTSSFSRFRPLGEYALDVAANSFFLPALLAAVLLGLGAWALVRSLPLIGKDADAARAFLFLGFPVVFVIVAEVITALGVAASPFVRNMVFLPAFVLVGLWKAPTWKSAYLRWAAVLLISVNVVLGIVWWTNIANGSGIVDYEGTAIGQTPDLRPLLDEGLGVVEIRCAWTDEPTCRLYERGLVAHGILVTYTTEEVPASACVMGKYPPRPGTGIEVLLKDGQSRLVCFG